jgi:putative ABC transport system permease protein
LQLKRKPSRPFERAAAVVFPLLSAQNQLVPMVEAPSHRRSAHGGSNRLVVRESLKLAVAALRAHKLRTLLTLVGMVLAVTTLVAVMSVVQGLNAYVADRIANLGSNAFVIDRIGIVTNFSDWVKAHRRPPLTVDDLHALQDRMRLALRVAAVVESQGKVRYGNQAVTDVDIDGITPDFCRIRNVDVTEGRLIEESDQMHHLPVCIIGADLVKRLFPNVDAIGKSLRVGPAVYQIVGTAKPLGTVFGQSLDNSVYVPLGTYQKSFSKPDDSVAIFVEAPSPELMSAAADEARVILRSRRHLRYDAPDNFAVIFPSSITGLWQRLTGSIAAMAVSLTAVFLVVGGIVIMNIMLASVTERTREIGIRKAMGARRRHIVLQFLIESLVLSLIGGLIGVGLALGVAALVRSATPIPITTSVGVMVVAVVLAMVVGLFFGIYPALRAARLDPIQALRSEG